MSRGTPGWARALIVVTGGCAGTILALISMLLYREVAKPPPFTFTAAEYRPVSYQLCPGDTLVYQPRLTVTRTPALIVVVRTLWDVAEQRTLVPERTPSYFVWTDQDRGQSVQRTVRYPLPDDLLPGLYEVRGATAALNSEATAYVVRFAIPESCRGQAPQGDTP
ncbi:hypothetical protein IHN32_00325 [Deinococcus sp. 14RED07]|uniref:hypothetical protein n=1 Tax=unclassified Deinococcus TaxID=2623546 RepID=UPI001E3B6ACB|nr:MULTISPECIES: hypothetical protein [unclassified Deinococcus]MCD0164869.1 hypothetical protein [Deinococcus sp. 12RED42]MCD0174402.1 hypothetical protein [Deinococcus sp. 14RED07]